MRIHTFVRRTMPVGIVAMCASAALVAGQAPDAAGILSTARAALGGDAKLSGVTTIFGSGKQTKTANGRTTRGGYEIAWELPNKFAVREVFTQVASFALMRSRGFNGDDLINVSDSPPQVPGMVMRTASGTSGGTNASPAEVQAARQALLKQMRQEYARIALGLIGASPAAFPLQFASAGEADRPDGKADVIAVTGGDGFDARLFVDQKSHLPVFVSWQARPPLQFTQGTGSGASASSGDLAERMKAAQTAPPVEYRLSYSDYRDVNGVKLPFTMQRSIAGEVTDEVTIDKYKVNEKIDPKKFSTK